MYQDTNITNYSKSSKNFLLFIYGNYTLLDYFRYYVEPFEAP